MAISEEERIMNIIKEAINKQGYLHTVESNGRTVIVSHNDIDYPVGYEIKLERI